MKDLIEALQILLKYVDDDPLKSYAPTHCEHDVLMIVGVNPADVSDEDKELLDELGFHISDEYGEPMFCSFRFGSA